MWAASTIKTFGTKKLKRLFNLTFEEMQTRLPPITEKVRHVLLSSVLDCCIMIDFSFLGYFYQSINPWDIAIGCINRSRTLASQRNHFNNSSGNVSILQQLHWRMIYSLLSFDFYWIFLAHTLH
jgi:hypothetical protein